MRHPNKLMMDLTSLSSPMRPLIAKYKKPPDVKASASGKYCYPITLPNNEPAIAPVDVINWTNKI